jgi:glycosyltransferase involved in cell wall biosynthesis
MSTPKISVIIPVYNGATYLGATIQSVLVQTYANLELIVVDDASPDHSSEIVGQFDDPRLRYIVHERNHGADTARHTGLQASCGEIIAFLDQDDLFHQDKLNAHVAYLEQHPEIGFTYNDRFELNYSAETIRDLWRPPRRMTLADLVLGFPLSPSDVVLRREWAMQLDLPGGGQGSEISLFGRLCLTGCEFGCVERALNFRRYHSGRIIGNIEAACSSEINCQNKVFSDPHCPPEVVALRHMAHANLYVGWAFLAFKQRETAAGQEFLSQALRLKPSLIEGRPGELVTRFLHNSLDDETLDHGPLLQEIFAQLPHPVAGLSKWLGWATAYGFLFKGARAIIWHRLEDGAKYFAKAASLGVQLDDPFLNSLTDKLLVYEAEFGAKAAEMVVHNLAPYLKQLGGSASIRRLKSLMAVNRAFHHYNAGEYAQVPAALLSALVSNPKHLANRGVLSILVRSVLAGRTSSVGPVAIGLR